MKKLLALLFVPSLFIAMELPVTLLSPRTRENARQQAEIRALRVEYEALKELSVDWHLNAESGVENLESQFAKLQEQLAILLNRKEEQKDAARVQEELLYATVNGQAALASLNRVRGLQIATLAQAQEVYREQSNRQHAQARQQQAALEQRIAAAEKSNYYLKWALGITTTAFTIMGYLLWKNQPKPATSTASKPVVDAKSVQPTSNPVATPALAQQSNEFDTCKYVTIEYLEKRLEELPSITRIIGQNGKDIYLKFNDSTGNPSYSPQFWPNNGQP